MSLANKSKSQISKKKVGSKMETKELFKVENKEFAIRSSKTRCEYCSEILANFEAMMFGTHCSTCHYSH